MIKNIAYIIIYLSEENAFNSIKNISLFINTRNRCVSTFEKKYIPCTSAVHMPFKNAVMYILLYGTAESYYLQKALDKDCKVPTKRVWHPTHNKTSYYSELNERLIR